MSKRGAPSDHSSSGVPGLSAFERKVWKQREQDFIAKYGMTFDEAEALKEDFPESVAEETPVSDSEFLYDETEDSSGVDDPNEHNCPRFKASRRRATGSARIANDFVVRAVRE